MIWVREKVRWVHVNESYIFKKRLKIRQKVLTNYHVIKCFWYWKNPLLLPALQSHTTAPRTPYLVAG